MGKLNKAVAVAFIAAVTAAAPAAALPITPEGTVDLSKALTSEQFSRMEAEIDDCEASNPDTANECAFHIEQHYEGVLLKKAATKSGNTTGNKGPARIIKVPSKAPNFPARIY